jgi:deoxycytidylate deaminase
MLTDEEKRFFADTARGASNLSSCPVKRGAVLTRGHKILSTGHNRRIIPEKEWETSAVFDAIFSARDVDLTGSFIFTTHFPDIEDTKLIITTGITYIYFFGSIPTLGDPVVELLNSLNSESILLEICQLN